MYNQLVLLPEKQKELFLLMHAVVKAKAGQHKETYGGLLSGYLLAKLKPLGGCPLCSALDIAPMTMNMFAVEQTENSISLQKGNM